MCVIVIKPTGVKAPSNEIIKNCWDNNPDGAGFMFGGCSTVVIRKGFKKFKQLQKALKALEKEIDTTDHQIVYHFRVGTSGGNTAANTHPFPVSTELADLQKLETNCKLAVVHNGIVNIKRSRDDISDTMQYITDQIALLHQIDPNFFRDKTGQKIIQNISKGSKWAFMDTAGKIYTIGEFTEYQGLLFSNYSYMKFSSFKYDFLSNYFYHPKKYRQCLMAIDGQGYIILSNGDLVEGWGYYMDIFNNVYAYDYETCECFQIDAAAYSNANTPLKFDESIGEFMTIEA